MGIPDKLKYWFSSWSPGARRAGAMAVDAIIVVESFAMALLFRFNGSVPDGFWERFWPFALLSALLFLGLLYESGVYRNVLRYTGIYQGVRIAGATSMAAGVLVVTNLLIGMVWLRPVPLSVILVGAVLAYVQIVAVRLYPRIFYEFSLREVGERYRAIIVGAEESGVMLARQIGRTPEMGIRLTGFVDADRSLWGKQIEGVPVLGGPEDLRRLIETQGVDQVLIAMSGAAPEQIEHIWQECVDLPVEVKVVPKLSEVLAQGTVRLRELRIQDLLGREPVHIDLDALAAFINGKRVLVTGAGGSIGSELCRQISHLGPAKLVALDRDESALYYLEQELHQEGYFDMEAVVGDVTIPERMQDLFNGFRPQLVFHAAAYKHVPLMELHVAEAIVNNVEGTLNVARTAGEFGVEKFINVSTDKAVNPANVMGATKRLAEMIVRGCALKYTDTTYASVRFGNVLGSRGSVVPTFKRQIEAGGPVTVTHPDMTRYFMIIPEAVSLILQAGSMVESYGTYVLEMGRPVNIMDLAHKMIEIMGAKGIQIKFIGLRPGEKLREELFEAGERQMKTGHPMIFRLMFKGSLQPDFWKGIERVISYARRQESEKALELLRLLVPTYRSAEESSQAEPGRAMRRA